MHFVWHNVPTTSPDHFFVIVKKSKVKFLKFLRQKGKVYFCTKYLSTRPVG